MSDGNIYFLTNDQRDAILWAIRLGLDRRWIPVDPNRESLRSAQSVLDGSWKDEAEGPPWGLSGDRALGCDDG